MSIALGETRTTPVVAADARDFLARRRRAITSAWAGFALDSYSIYLPNTALLPAMGYFQANLSPAESSLFVGMTFAATLLGRPVGAILFGSLADRLGRQRIGAITIYGFGTVTLLIGLLPGAEQIGATLATALLIGLRFLDGIFLGGEYTAATPLAIEYAPADRRGLIGGLVQCSASGGPFVIAIITSILALFIPVGDVHSPYVQWGWRIPFFIGAILAYAVAHFLRRRVEDSETFKTAPRSKSPVLDMLKGESGKAFIQVWIIMTGVFFASNMLGSVLPQLLLGNPGFTAADLFHTQLFNAIPAIATYITLGWLSDKIGRKPALLVAGAMTLIITPITLTLVATHSVQGWVNLTLLSVLTNVAVVGSFGVLPSYINERFATAVRSSGWGVGYSTAVIVPSFFAYYQLGLAQFVPTEATAGILAALGGLIVIVGSRLGPETAGKKL